MCACQRAARAERASKVAKTDKGNEWKINQHITNTSPPPRPPGVPARALRRERNTACLQMHSSCRFFFVCGFFFFLPDTRTHTHLRKSPTTETPCVHIAEYVFLQTRTGLFGAPDIDCVANWLLQLQNVGSGQIVSSSY